MNCKSVQTYLSAYLDGELCGQESLQVRDHLMKCGECQAEEQQLRTLKQMLRGLPTYTPNAGFEDRLVASVMGKAIGRPVLRLHLNFRWQMATGMVAAGILIALAVTKLTERSVPGANALPVATRDSSFEISRDQLFMAGNDPLSGNRFVVPTSYGKD